VIPLPIYADNSATVVKGLYPEQLLSAWDAYAQDKKTENERPSKFSETQTFCIIQLKHHGQDLESHSISTWSEAAHIFWSVVRALTRGEKECEFEHRDLHWGNIMIDRSEEDEVLERLLDNLNLEDGGKELLDGGWGGVKVTLIDYTLSRAKVNDLIGPVAHFAFEDESLFEGKRMCSLYTEINVLGDYQFDIYRQMRALVSDENGATWEQYQPATNVLWLHYLADKLLYAKQLPTPVTRLSARNQSKQLGGARKRGHERSFSVILEGEDKEAYEGLFNIFGKINPKLNSSLGSASDVLELGKENGWAV
jgi:serine/threonine-protein kinase haspin